MLHVTTPQPLQITTALQEACMWASKTMSLNHISQLGQNAQLPFVDL